MMPKFCHECGEKLASDNSKFCSFCGTKLIGTENNTNKTTKVSYQEYNKEKYGKSFKDESHNFRKTDKVTIGLGIFTIILGFFIIWALYYFPAFKLSGVYYSIAQIHSSCSTPFLSSLMGEICSTYDIFFYLGWICAIASFLLGIYGIVIGSEDSAKSNNLSPVQQKKSVLTIHEEKSPLIASLCSFFIPGLGQVYDGETARGIGIFSGTIIGLFIFLIPGLIVWIFGIYDAYSIANKMNNDEIPFKPTNTAHLIIFIILTIFITAVVIFLALFFFIVIFAYYASLAFHPFIR